jgi:hypothetical protein
VGARRQLQDADAAAANIGKIQIKETTLSSRQMGEAVLISPQQFGLQMNPETGTYQQYIDFIEVMRDDVWCLRWKADFAERRS